MESLRDGGYSLNDMKERDYFIKKVWFLFFCEGMCTGVNWEFFRKEKGCLNIERREDYGNFFL